jgi:hypothetical protein
VPPATQPYNPSVLTETTITGNLTLFSTRNAAGDVQIRAAQLHIATDGQLALEQAGIRVTGTTVVDGLLTFHRSTLYGWLDISPGGVVTMVNSTGTGFGSTEPVPASGAWVTNRGTFIGRFSQFERKADASGAAALFHTFDGGATHLGATIAYRAVVTSPDCRAPPLSARATTACSTVGSMARGTSTVPAASPSTTCLRAQSVAVQRSWST